ncbi:RecQ family ATP-dependent DNA helicase [Bacteroides caecigallinarum]|uniref:RecQ family ATP-dependent DNA helicase n=1 Tax=Bacteroides caecigallinarum TaxID=1411144 RepID=UPI00195927D3|nr:ATP-dependent DNA helicase RecQ [Bacteroides caecigallinarum]MBM6960173.1 RecQ family ATP-dependent DNA helicase [Bacteroides caecigallinarum]
MTDDYRKILKDYWGYDNFRGIQEDIIRSIGSGRDTLGLMPTGGGKSITFQVPAMAKDGLCIVITPLIALMKDQVRNLRDRGIKAIAIYSGMTREEIIIALENCIFGNYKFLYISPERLDTEIFRIKLRSMKVSLITVDESHCISQWGYDFRPAYLKISEIRNLLPGVPVLALTATATPEVVKDIQQRLAFKEENVFRMSFERKNLAYIVRRTESKQEELLHILKHVDGSAIVYAHNRKRTKEYAQLLNENGITATFYHAGLNNETKDQRQKSWVKGETRVMVATNAFGMGIDKPDVRLVVHVDIPDSPEAYFQEAGRGGRDGKKAYAVLLYARSDKATLKKRITDTFPEKDYIRTVYEHLNYYYQMAMGDGLSCTREFNIDEFCRNFKHFPIQVDSALKILTRAGYLEYTDEQDNNSRLMFTLTKEELYRIHETSPETEKLINIILRSYTGVFTEYAYINEETLSLRTGMTRQQVYDTLISLTRRRILHYIPGKKTPYIIYTRERQEADRLIFTKEVYEDRKKSFIRRIEAMTEYAETEDKCRSRMLLLYFGEKNEHNCGQCDVCLSSHSSGIKQGVFDEISRAIEETLKEKDMTTSALMEKLESYDKENVTKVLSYLLAEEIIHQKNGMLSLPK